MPTIPQITAAKLLLTPQAYNEDLSKLTGDSQKILLRFLRKYLIDYKQVGKYSDAAIITALAAAVGIDAAMLQAILTNVSNEGSQKAKLQGELEYLTQDTIDNELAIAFTVLFVPKGSNNFGGTKESEVAKAIRDEFSRAGNCYGNEYQKTRC
jgi:hypothetical protein